MLSALTRPVILSAKRVVLGPNPDMNISTKGKLFIKKFEKLELKAYQDQGGVWTIGWGTTKGVYAGMVIDEVTAERWFQEELNEIVPKIRKLIQVPVSQGQFDALVSFTYNCGLEAFRVSTLRRVLNNREYDKVPQQFLRWVFVKGKKSNGLVNRRTAESIMFIAG